MSSTTIDTLMAKRMIEGAAMSGAAIVGQPGGWSVTLKLGETEKLLCAQRTDKPRLWRSLDRLLEYLINELHIDRVDSLDARNFSAPPPGGKARVDTSERMRRTHETAAHDKWFREQVAQAIDEADDPKTEWVSDEDADAAWAKQRAAFAKRIEGKSP